MNPVGQVVELNVGGCIFTTTLSTLTEKKPFSKLSKSILAFCSQQKTDPQSLSISIIRDSKQRMFIDRDGEMFKYVLDYLRRSKTPCEDWVSKLLPHSNDQYRFRLEAEFYGLSELMAEIDKCQDEHLTATLMQNSIPILEAKPCIRNVAMNNNISRRANSGPLASGGPYYISIGCRGYYTASREGPSNDMSKFRKITRITVSGRADVAKEVFMDELNESRDPERFPPHGYTSRYYLKHNYLEFAFEALGKSGFELLSACSTGAKTLPSSAKEEFKQWTTYMEYVFYRKEVTADTVQS